jgi:peptidoglycan-N-acetylmuramic acid deacetylase
MKSKPSHGRYHSRKVRKQQGILAFALGCTILLVIIIYAIGSCSDRIGGESQVQSASSSIAFSSDSATPTLTPTLTPTIFIPTNTPTVVPIDPSGLSNARRGWSYSYVNPESAALCEKYNGIWQGDPESNIVYLTMDIGYDFGGLTATILDVAKEKNIKISFFVVGTILEKQVYRDLIMRAYNEGHLILNHSFSHDKYPVLYAEKGAEGISKDLADCSKIISELTGEAPPMMFRYPSGEHSEATMAAVHNAGYKTVFWNLAYKDWLTDAQPDPEDSLELLLSGTKKGSIVLLHNISTTNVEILPEYIDGVHAMGLEFALLDELE